MPTKNISLGPGTLYIQTPGGLEPFCGISEGTLEAEETEWPKENPYILAADLAKGSEFTCEAQLSPEAYNALFAWDLKHRISRLFHSYPNSRVMHLALYHKKKRIRKKNTRRIYKDLKRALKEPTK